jgi:hypothetical protein
MKKLVAILLTTIMLLSSSAMAEETLLEKILKPDVGAKPMARLWLPDAGAGYIEEDGTNYLWMAEQYIQEMYDAGMGGVELTMVSDGSDLFYDNAGQYGWGTDAHVRLLKAFVAKANEMPDGFITDITITSHWPVVINTVDPNDVEQQQQLRSVTQKLKKSDLAGNTIELALPPQRTLTFSNNAQMQSPFFYVERLQGAVIAQVTEVDETGAPTAVEFTSLADMHGAQAEAIGPAGIPDTIVDDVTGETVKLEDGMVVEVLEGWKRYTVRKDLYTLNRADVADASYGASNMGTVYFVNADGSLGDIAYKKASWSANVGEYGNSIMPIFNMDLWGSSERMNDTQYAYTVNTSDVRAYLDARDAELNDDEAVSVGDYVLINCYSEGSGQLQSGGSGILMNPQYFAVDFFNAEGAQKAIDYWNDNMLYWMETKKIAEGYEYKGMDSTLADLLAENSRLTNGASCIFEDSIECHIQYSAWCIDGVEEYQKRYNVDPTAYLPIICGMNVANDNGNAESIKENYQLMLGDLYDREHAAPISEWTNTFGCSYRAQPYSLTGLDVTASSIAVDIPEGDNSTVGDGLRTMRASVNMSDKRYLSMESLTFGYESFLEWTPIEKQINSDYCDGVNRVIFHGSPFNRAYDGSFHGYNSQYPGWSWGFMNWNSRQLWWDYAHGITDYVSSIQALLQNGTNKVDVAFLRDKSESFNFSFGDAYAMLMNNGYSYNLMSEQAFMHEKTIKNAVAENGMIYTNGPAYKALIIDNNKYISGAMADRLVQFADAGVPILFVGDLPAHTYGTESYEGENEHIIKQLAALTARDNVSQIERVSTELEVEAIPFGPPMMGSREVISDETLNNMVKFLKDNGVEPYAQYFAEGLQTMIEYDKTDDSYYYYLFNDSPETITAEVKLLGEGTAYIVDAFERTVTQADNVIWQDGRAVLTVSIMPSDVKIVALSSNYNVFPEPRDIASYTLTVGETISYPDGWRLMIEDHTPKYTKEEVAADTQVNPSLTTIITQDVGEISLATWDQTEFSPEILKGFNKADGSRLAGIGTYIRAITLENAGDCAVLSFKKPNATNILKVIVNGVEYDHINAVTLQLTTDKLVNGENVIEIVVGTGGANIGESAPASFMGPSGPAQPSTGHGLTGFSITTYTKD